MYKREILWILVSGILLFSACKKDNSAEATLGSGKIKINFIHTIGMQAVKLDTNCYINEAGNHYELTDIMYFISDVKFYSHFGTAFLISIQPSHYTNIRLPSTLSWNIIDAVPAGIYDSISFIFGLNEIRNHSNAFVNPPETNMAWPDMLGGGYHYMMLNGKWLNPQNIASPFNFHIGIGQIYTDTVNYDVNTITAFVQNYFKVSLPLSSLQITNNNTSTITLNMAIDSWFKTPHTWDHNYWGGSMMQNQRALQCIKENGFDVFSVN